MSVKAVIRFSASGQLAAWNRFMFLRSLFDSALNRQIFSFVLLFWQFLHLKVLLQTFFAMTFCPCRLFSTIHPTDALPLLSVKRLSLPQEYYHHGSQHSFHSGTLSLFSLAQELFVVATPLQSEHFSDNLQLCFNLD